MLDKPNSEARIESFKQRNGCENRNSEKPRRTHGNINFHNCYCNHLDLGFSNLLSMTEFYNKGFLPFSGSVLEQPAKAMEVISILTSLRTELEEKLQKQNTPKGKR